MTTNSLTYNIEIGAAERRADASDGTVRFEPQSEAVPLTDRARLRSFTGTLADGAAVPLYVEEGEGDHDYVVYVRGEAVHVHLVTPRDERLLALRKNTRVAGSTGQIVAAPMPGFLKAILVEVGQVVEKGTSLCILEAMKMENEIKAPGRLVVQRLVAGAGTAVEKGAALVELGPVVETSA